jgi:two-component system sensor histidine kinase BaeS
MRLSVRAKLFLTLLLTGLAIIAGTHAFLHWSFQRGLEELAAERRQQQIERIAERLTGLYQQDGGWQRLRADKRLWIGLLMGRIDPERLDRLHAGPGPAFGPGSRPGPGRAFGQHLGPRWMHRALDEPGVWPPTPAAEGADSDRHPLPLELRLMLLDADDHLIYGRAELLEAAAERYPLLLDDIRIGSLAVLPGASITELADLRFRERQSGHLLIIALAMALLAALIAIPLSALLTRPVGAFQRAIEQLADGNYRARVEVSGSDELGRLGKHLNALAEALEQTEQARKRWVADISHELRTPLALLRADIEALQDGVRPLDQDALAGLHADALRLGRLVDDLYQLSMTDLGALSYRKQPIDLAVMLDAELDSFRPRFQQAGLSLDLLRRGNGPWLIQADEQRLSQLFRNLLRNSLRYTDARGALRVTLQCGPEGLSIDFEDTAPGVPEETLPRLFERLYRVEQSRSRATGGAGLGLAIARNIVAAHGGTIDARQSPLGGLRIHIELPVPAAAERAP